MIEVIKDAIKRDGVKIGWIGGNYIHDRNDKKIAVIDGKAAFDMAGKKIAYIDGDFVIFPQNESKVHIEENNKLVGGVVSDIMRAAIRLVLA